MVAEGLFRTDLYYRLNVVRVEVPPLRERREDIPLLVHHFLRKHRDGAGRVEGIDDGALERLVAAEWPGNIRELENAVESALALAAGPRLRASDFEHTRPAATGPSTHAAKGLPLTLEAYERAVLDRALRENAGDARAAARCLGIGRSTFYRKLTEHGLQPRRRGGGC
jgi:DNA-binding NtrC family response regulator